MRDSHFARSSEVDIESRSSDVGVSVRRVTSMSTFTLENCRVKNWTNPKGAIHKDAPTALLFDNVFEGSAESKSPVSYLAQRGKRIVANNTMQGSTNLFFQEEISSGYTYKVHIFDVDGYVGSIFLGPSCYYVRPLEMRMSLRGPAKADMYFLGNTYYESGPVFVQKSPTIQLHWLGTRIMGNTNIEARLEAVKDTVSQVDYHKYSVMLDDLRKLGTYDINTNFPNLVK